MKKKQGLGLLIGGVAAVGLLAGCGVTQTIGSLPKPGSTSTPPVTAHGVTNYGYRTFPFAKPFLPKSGDIIVNDIRVMQGVLKPLPASAKGVSPAMYKKDQLIMLWVLELDWRGLHSGSFHIRPIKGDIVDFISYNREISNTGLSVKGIVFNLGLTTNGKKQTYTTWIAYDSGTKFAIGVPQ